MSKSLLLIICDFLLLSLLAWVRFEPDELEEVAEVALVEEERAEEADLVEILQQSLESEKAEQDKLNDLLAQKESALEDAQANLEAKDSTLSETADKLEQTAEELAEQERLARELAAQKAALAEQKRLAEEEKARIAAAKAELEKEKEQLNDKVNQTREELLEAERQRAALNQDIAAVGEDAAAAKERLRLVQEQLKAREDALDRSKEELAALESERSRALQESERLRGQVKVLDTEKRMTEANLASARAEIATVRTEKDAIQATAHKLAEGTQTLAAGTAKLAERTGNLEKGVTTLAHATGQIKEEVKETIKQIKPLTTNTIFDTYTRNKITVTFRSRTSRGRVVDTVSETVLVTDGKDTFALVHTEDTPLDLTGFGNSRPTSLSATVRVGTQNLTAKAIGFLALDPRVMVIPVPAVYAQQQGVEVFKIDREPFTFPEAVLISGQQGYYGETQFKIDPGGEHHLRMLKKPFSRLLGYFTPGKSDLVFSKTGGFIGIMVNNKFCAQVDNFYIPQGQALSVGERYTKTLGDGVHRTLRSRLQSLPSDFR